MFGDHPGVGFARSEVSQVIDTQKISDLPISGRDFIDFALLTPGVAVGRSTSVGAQSPFQETVLQLSFGGLRETHSAFFGLDGNDYTTSISGLQRESPSLDWVREFRVASSPYTADNARHLGAVVNTVTKSGGNSAHGSAYEFFRNNQLIQQSAPLRPSIPSASISSAATLAVPSDGTIASTSWGTRVSVGLSLLCIRLSSYIAPTIQAAWAGHAQHQPGKAIAGLAASFFGDTWIWTGGGWRQAADTGPRGRYAHAMVFDERAGVVLLYGGAAAHRDAPLSDMWQWDGATWREIQLTGETPGHRYQPVMVYDRARGRTVLYGGLAGAFDTWEWDGRALASRQPLSLAPHSVRCLTAARCREYWLVACPR